MKSKMRITVYLFNGHYYAMISTASSKKLDSAKEMFSVECDIDSWELKELQEKALLKAQEMGITDHIIGIND
jgi:hypothetical protein